MSKIDLHSEVQLCPTRNILKFNFITIIGRFEKAVYEKEINDYISNFLWSYSYLKGYFSSWGGGWVRGIFRQLLRKPAFNSKLTGQVFLWDNVQLKDSIVHILFSSAVINNEEINIYWCCSFNAKIPKSCFMEYQIRVHVLIKYTLFDGWTYKTRVYLCELRGISRRGKIREMSKISTPIIW